MQNILIGFNRYFSGCKKDGLSISQRHTAYHKRINIYFMEFQTETTVYNNIIQHNYCYVPTDFRGYNSGQLCAVCRSARTYYINIL